MLKDLLGETIQTMLEAEIEDNLVYSKHNYKYKITNKSRNGLDQSNMFRACCIKR